MEKGAIFSDCREYRYFLKRIWDHSLNVCCFVGLNPSTADETIDDPTIRRCINYAKDWGYGGLYMANIFAYRATDPKEMKKQPDPIGEENNYWIDIMISESRIVIAAWGNHGAFMQRSSDIKSLFPGKFHCLGTTKIGEPKHPLYLRKDLKPIPFN